MEYIENIRELTSAQLQSLYFIARFLDVKDSECLLVDEVTTSLVSGDDEQMRDRLQRLMYNIRKKLFHLLRTDMYATFNNGEWREKLRTLISFVHGFIDYNVLTYQNYMETD